MTDNTPYKTLGILGGGQLGRMSAEAAKGLDITTVILTPEENAPASQVADRTIIADYTDENALQDFANSVDVISYEFENIPIKTIQYLKNLKPVYPNEHLLEVSQDRLIEKSFLNNTGIDTARWESARSIPDVDKALDDWETSQCIIKTTRFGYDGKGQAFIKGKSDIPSAWNQLKANIAIIEEIVDFQYEISVIVARDAYGTTQIYGPQKNDHKNHILHRTTIPFEMPDNLKHTAIRMAETLAKAVNLRGVLTLEMFVTKDNCILANEIAPRTHNSGHWSIDACTVSQFENHVRAVCGLPVLPPGQHSAAEMINLIGEDIYDLQNYKDNPNAHIHLYGKTDARAGRKMGHVTILKNKL